MEGTDHRPHFAAGGRLTPRITPEGEVGRHCSADDGRMSAQGNSLLRGAEPRTIANRRDSLHAFELVTARLLEQVLSDKVAVEDGMESATLTTELIDR
jgi:hypothetical protein